jgi:ABC-type nickel/cobalt efflux system permease component RcnA
VFNPAYIGVVIIGLLHGLEPGHGWPVAMLYSTRKRTPLLSGLVSSGIIALAHFVSSIAVLVAYLLLKSWLDFEAPWLKYLAAALLLVLAYRMFKEKVNGLEQQHGHIHESELEAKHEHEHEHPGQIRHIHWHKHTREVALTLWGLASFAFVLGFAHEEEFALLALVAGGVNATILMTLYALSVAFALIGITLLSVKIYGYLKPRFQRYEKYIPKIGAGVLAAMAIIIILW